MREPRPITRVEISEKNKTLRLIAAALLLVIGIVGITSGIMSLLNKEAGWQTVEVSTEERGCSENFILQYQFSGSGAQTKTLNNKLQAVYGEACVKAYQLFTPDEEIPGVNNVYYVNHNPNTVVTVDPLLYQAFEKLDETPWLYLGPVYAHYYSLILNTEESRVLEMDPALDPDAKAYLARIAEFAADREAVQLELLGNNQVKLSISQAYLEFAESEEIENYIDFAYMTNAFVIDYLADTLITQGLTDGYLVSVDGYTRNLDEEHTFNFTVFDRVGDMVNPAGAMEYQGPISIVFLKNYALNASDAYYRASGDHVVHLFADPQDGLYKTSRENLVSYSYELGCADVLLKMLPCFVGSDASIPEAVYSVWCEENTICYNDEAVSMDQLLQSGQVSYRAEYVN